LAELCDLYLADAMAGRVLTRSKVAKKTSTLAIDHGRIERHIKPLLGPRSVGAVTREDVEGLLHDIAAGKTAGKTKTAKKRGLARVRGGRTQPIELLVSWARSSPMQCATGCERTIRYAEWSVLRTVSAIGG